MLEERKKQAKLINDLPNVFRTILKKYNLSPGDFPDITKFSALLKDVKFQEFASLQEKQIEELDACLSLQIPRLMEELPSEKDTPETLRHKMGNAVLNPNATAVPMPTRTEKFGKRDNEGASNPFGYAQEDEDNYWALQDSAERLLDSFESHGPVGGFLSTQVARNILLKTGLGKEELRQIWNLSDIDRDGCFDHHEYVVAMFLCDAVTQKNRPIPAELPPSVVPPSKRHLLKKQKEGHF